MCHIKSYKPSTESATCGQVLKCGYSYEQTKIVIQEMTEQLIQRLIDNNLVAEGIVLHIGYDWISTADGDYSGPVQINHYGKTVPKSARGTAKLGSPTACPSRILKKTMEQFDKIIDKKLYTKHLSVTAIRLSHADEVAPQMGFFVDITEEKKEIDLVRAVLQIQKKHGKNAVFKAYNLLDGATALERNTMIGGHKAG